jgi:tripartite-type tricarboxylate transporter receptor subunit TctC
MKEMIPMILRVSFSALFASVFLQAAVNAQGWPTQPIRAVVPFSAGGAVDVIARAVFDEASRQLGQAVVIENKVGAGGTIGAALAAKSEPDGHTILIHSSSHTVSPALMPKLPYDAAADFTAVIPLAAQPTMLFVSAAKGYKSIHDFVAAGKAKSGAMNFGSGGVGNATHLVAERFLLSAGFKAAHVPFRGSPEALREVLSERIDFSFSTLLPALPMLQAGTLKALATSEKRRAAALPDVPTTIEVGFPNSGYSFWIGVFVPKGTSQTIVDMLHREISKALSLPNVQEKLRQLGAEPMPMTSAQFNQLIVDEIAINKELVRAAGIQVN